MRSFVETKRLRQIAELEVMRLRRALPESLHEEALGVNVVYPDAVDEALLEMGFESDMLGLFEGESLSERGQTPYPAPPIISLFVENIWDFSGQNMMVFRDQIRVTYLHELGHYFGWDEDDLARRELD